MLRNEDCFNGNKFNWKKQQWPCYEDLANFKCLAGHTAVQRRDPFKYLKAH